MELKIALLWLFGSMVSKIHQITRNISIEYISTLFSCFRKYFKTVNKGNFQEICSEE